MEIWELPSFSISSDISIKDNLERFFSEQINISDHKIIKNSAKVNRYELPKEFQSVTGASGEEHRFMYIKAKSANLKDVSRYDDITWITIPQMPSMIRMKNINMMTETFENEFQDISESRRKEQQETKKYKENIFSETDIDKLF
ncbi:MAG: hypothetical protein ACLFPQ_04400 [Candidatus Woesearchaeota archaeon]